MQFRTLIVGFLLGGSVALVSSQTIFARPQDSQQGGGAHNMQQLSPEEVEKMMEQWMQLMAPGHVHQLMQQFVGEFNKTTAIYMNGPNAEPVITKGTSTRRSVLGGRFILQEENSTMMVPGPDGNEQPVPWNGLGMFGYDNFRNMLVGCWADSMGTQLLTMKGTVDPTGKVFTYYGEMDEPSIKVIGRTVKYVATIVDDDTQTFEIYDLAAGDNYRVVRVEYKRSKAAE